MRCGWAVLAFSFLLLGCESPTSTSRLEVQRTDGGALDGSTATTISVTWTYRSGEVDVDATLVTSESADGCSTIGRLVIDTATASPTRYALADTPCSALRLTDTGDIVMYELPTGHDWSSEPLKVDTSAELIELGPWAPGVDGGVDYRFTLSAPACGGGCDCPVLRRRAGDEDLFLPLGQRCG
jgi:hypothetical protein